MTHQRDSFNNAGSNQELGNTKVGEMLGDREQLSVLTLATLHSDVASSALACADILAKFESLSF